MNTPIFTNSIIDNKDYIKPLPDLKALPDLKELKSHRDKKHNKNSIFLDKYFSKLWLSKYF